MDWPEGTSGSCSTVNVSGCAGMMGGRGARYFDDSVVSTEADVTPEFAEGAGFERKVNPRITPSKMSATTVGSANTNHLTRGCSAFNRGHRGCPNRGESCVRDARGASDAGCSSRVDATAETTFWMEV